MKSGRKAWFPTHGSQKQYTHTSCEVELPPNTCTTSTLRLLCDGWSLSFGPRTLLAILRAEKPLKIDFDGDTDENSKFSALSVIRSKFGWMQVFASDCPSLNLGFIAHPLGALFQIAKKDGHLQCSSRPFYTS
jgi:hypothetical protein